MSAQHPLQQSDRWQPMSFTQATDIHDLVARRRSLHRRILVMRALTVLLISVALILALIPFAMQWYSAHMLQSRSQTAASVVSAWPDVKTSAALQAAHDYNRRLASDGQPVLGEAADPFSSTAGPSDASEANDSAAASDEHYQSLVNTGNGVMGSVIIPKIGVDLPIYHGTSERALASGAGHLYGTSLPVGGANTHAVLTGHRGVVSAAMFTRLDELTKGDFFYIDVLGERLAYRVDRISVIEPSDPSLLYIRPNEDRVTLMTCTPYGVNTQRLLVSGTRVAMPVPAPDPTNIHDDRTALVLAIGTGVAVAAVGLLATTSYRRRQRVRRIRHARNR